MLWLLGEELLVGGWDRPPGSVTHPGAKWLSHLLTRPKWFPVVGPADQSGDFYLDESMLGKVEKGAGSCNTERCPPFF